MKKSMFLFIFGLFPVAALAYGYGVNDPLIAGYKAVGQALSTKNWPEIKQEINKLNSQIKNAQAFEEQEIDFTNAIEKENQKLLAQTYIHLTVATARSHLWWNLHEQVSDRYKAKSRINAIDRFLKDILGLQIKRKDPKLHRQLSQVLGEMRESLGSPGAFGIGSSPKDEQAFLNHVIKFDQILWKVFSFTAPPWLPDLNAKNALDFASQSLLEAQTADHFVTRKVALEKARTALDWVNQENWQKDFLPLFASMGSPQEGRRQEQKPDPQFEAQIKKLLEKISSKN